MKLGLVVQPYSDDNLRLAAQIGVEQIVYYDMTTMPDSVEVLTAERQRVQRFGMDMSVVEGGPPTTRIILHKDGRDEQIENWKRCLDAMGKAGINAVCYDWMAPNQGVVRTTNQVDVRAGATTTGFDLAQYDDETLTEEGETTAEQMWDDLAYFLKAVIPAAEAAEVKLAMHPDDPPLPRLQGLARIMKNVADFDRLFDLCSSPANAMTFCQGCFAEMGADIPATIAHFADRIAFVHFRDVRGTADSFHETFHEQGKTDMRAAMQAYRDAGVDAVIRPDHVPVLEGADTEAVDDGYTMLGRLYAVGYMRGLLDA